MYACVSASVGGLLGGSWHGVRSPSHSSRAHPTAGIRAYGLSSSTGKWQRNINITFCCRRKNHYNSSMGIIHNYAYSESPGESPLTTLWLEQRYLYSTCISNSRIVPLYDIQYQVPLVGETVGECKDSNDQYSRIHLYSSARYVRYSPEYHTGLVHCSLRG